MAWDGKDRREGQDWIERDRLLSEVHSDIKHVIEWTKTHTKMDDDRHGDNLNKFDKINASVAFHSKIIYGALGIVGFIEVVSKFLK